MKYNRPLIFRALPVQFLLIIVTAGVAGRWAGQAEGLASAFGGAVSLCSTALLAWRWWHGSTAYHCDGPRHLRAFRRSGLERLVAVMVLMALGLFGLRLDPRFLLMGFITGQLAWILAMAVVKAE